MAKEMFGLDESTIERLCAAPVEQPPYSPPKYPGKTIFDVALEGAKQLNKNPKARKALRAALGVWAAPSG